MVVDRAKIERLEKELEEAKRELWREDAKRYRILMREMSEADKERILGNLTDREERVLFGLEAPEEPKRVAVVRPAGGGGDSGVCSLRQERFDSAWSKAAHGANA